MLKKVAAIISICVLLLSAVSLAETDGNNGDIVRAIELSEQNLLIIKGRSSIIKAVIEPAGAKNKQTDWISTDEKVATVKGGQVRGLKNGKCDIICKAKDGGGAEAVCHVEVGTQVQSVSFEEKQITLCVDGPEEAGKAKLAVSFSPEDASWKELKWTTSDEAIATVDSEGVVTAHAEGKAVITAETMEPNAKRMAKCNLSVGHAVAGIRFEQEEYQINSTKGISIHAAIQPEDSVNKQLVWESADERVAVVDSKGNVRGAGEGATTITATAKDGSGVQAVCKVTVSIPVKSISFGKAKSFDLPIGIAMPIKVIVEPEGATVKGLKWESSNESIATVDENGNVTGLKKGNVKITATTTDGSKLKASAQFKADKYDVVFLDSKSKSFTYEYGSGMYTIKAKSKKGRVKISGIDKGGRLVLIGKERWKENATATPLKPGTDMIVVSAGSVTNYIKVFISPNAFDEETK